MFGWIDLFVGRVKKIPWKFAPSNLHASLWDPPPACRQTSAFSCVPNEAPESIIQSSGSVYITGSASRSPPSNPRLGMTVHSHLCGPALGCSIMRVSFFDGTIKRLTNGLNCSSSTNTQHSRSASLNCIERQDYGASNLITQF
jgi:hypothetical protein